MSRHVIEIPGDGFLIVGWDNPLQTFFASRYEDVDAEEESWSTDMINDKYTILANFAIDVFRQTGITIPADVMQRLNRDYDARTEPTPLQKRMAQLFK